MVEITLLRAQGLAVTGGGGGGRAWPGRHRRGQRAACTDSLLISLSVALNVRRWGDEAGEADMRVTDIADTGPTET